MTKEILTAEQLERANNLLDAVIDKLRLKNDSALAKALGVAAPVISKTRHGLLGITPQMMVRIIDAAGFALDEIRKILVIAPLVPRHVPM